MKMQKATAAMEFYLLHLSNQQSSRLMANACIGNAHFVQLVQSKLSTTDEMKYYQNHLVSHIYTIKILEQTDLLTFGCCLGQYIIYQVLSANSDPKHRVICLSTKNYLDWVNIEGEPCKSYINVVPLNLGIPNYKTFRGVGGGVGVVI